MLLKKRVMWVIKKIITPKSLYWDDARREFTLNILLLGSIILAAAGFAYKIVIFFSSTSPYEGLSPFILFAFLLFLCFLLFLSRIGKIKGSALMLIIFLFISSVYTYSQWGIESGQGLLIQALVIVMAGILINTRISFMISIGSFLSLIIVFYLHRNNIIKPDLTWMQIGPTLGKVLLFWITLMIIAITSWLSNRETERALRRAKRSETALRKQKEQLEILVEKRTQQLKQTQIEKITQLYRFAKFGRMASGLFHDLVNPLGLISLNLDRLSEKGKKLEQQEMKMSLDRAMLGTKRLESFVAAARKQIRQQEVLEMFSLNAEVSQVTQMLSYKAKVAKVRVIFHGKSRLQTFGNSTKFNQLMTNLLSNAIDAYDALERVDKKIEINLQKTKIGIKITVEDWGSGINPKNLPKIFDPLFTTKSFEKGTGIGLSICRDITEKDFKGIIKVHSREHEGTLFTVTFPIKKAPKGRVKVQNKS